MANILIIEDDFFINDIYSRAFKKAGYEVATYFEGKSGLAAAEKQNFDLVMLDIMMPGLTGLEVLKELRLKHPNLPVVLFTNLAQSSIIQEAIKLGAIGYQLKAGKSPAAVVEKISKYLQTKDASLFEAL